MNRPIIQGGMGVYISTPFLARKCSMLGNVLGTVSGVAAGIVMSRILQRGDPGGHFRRALEQFPFKDVSVSILDRYFVLGGIPAHHRYSPVPFYTINPRRDLIELMVAANFAFVWLAKEDHDNPVSINYLEKMQVPHIYSIYGAMLAGVDYVTMGAGLPLQIPDILSSYSEKKEAVYKIGVSEGSPDHELISFDPQSFFGRPIPDLRKPGFIPIISSNLLARLLSNQLEGQIDGFVVELPKAAGHNAPPRKKGIFNQRGEPVYGPRDEIDFDELKGLGIPFWLGGGMASPGGLLKAKASGAQGIQCGSIYALCDESGFDPSLRSTLRRLGYRKEHDVLTSSHASPTGFPFKVAKIEDTLSQRSVFDARQRICDLGALAVPYRRADGSCGYRCPAAPVHDYATKGGLLEKSGDAVCLCNALVSAASLGNPGEKPIVTISNDLDFLTALMSNENASYTAEDATRYILS